MSVTPPSCRFCDNDISTALCTCGAARDCSAAGSRDDSLAGETTQRSKSLHTGMKYPCLYPLPDGQRCLECITCQEVAMGGNVSLNVLAKNEKAARELLLELSEDPRVVTAHIALGAGKYLIPVRGE